MLSQKAKYAIKAMLVLREAEGPMQTREIAGRIKAPLHFLESTLFTLKTAGLVSATRGRSGGYRLGKLPVEISYADIMRAIDGPIALIPCASRNFYAPCADCTDVATCELRWALVRARDAAAGVLETLNLAQDPARLEALSTSV